VIRNVIEYRLKNKLLVNFEAFERKLDMLSRYELRDYVTQYSWIKPTLKNYNLIESALKKINANKILDIGCGSGYWTYHLNKMGFNVDGIKVEMYTWKKGEDITGVDVIDLCEKCTHKNFYHMDDEELNKYDTFYVSWPPYSAPLGTDAFKKFLKLNNVKNYVFIGEPGGCTGDNELYELLTDEDFHKENNLVVREYHDFDSFDTIHDYLITVSKTN